MPSGRPSASSAPLLGSGRRARRATGSALSSAATARGRQAELAAAFGGSEDENEEEESGGGAEGSDGRHAAYRGRGHLDLSGLGQQTDAASPPTYVSPSIEQRRDEDVFFDAGDALAESFSNLAGGIDPLGAGRINSNSEGTRDRPSASHERQVQARPSEQQPHMNTVSGGSSSSGAPAPTYDFEDTSYFAPPRSATRPSRANSRAASRVTSRAASPSQGQHDAEAAGTNDLSTTTTPLSRARVALGRFGRFVGMRVPGATYSTLSGEDESVATQVRRRIVGSGIGQDGVFANLNAKPERRRRRGNGSDDRGDDDDLAEEVLPPSYEIAAADATPPYWETTIIGGPGGLHPLAPGGMGWTPGGAHVGALEDLIIDGLPVGNFFGFAWNLLVSMSFQFVGFLLTYLLHTTHAARCGSRAGLGITLVQYGFYLRTRAQQIAEGKPMDDGLSPLPPGAAEPTSSNVPTPSISHSWWGDLARPHAPPAAATEGARSLVGRGLHFAMRQANEVPAAAASAAAPTATSSNGSLADALAADDGLLSMGSNESMSASTEWLAYVLMGLGWFILLTSLISYWRVHRWGKRLVDTAQRENEGVSGAPNEPGLFGDTVADGNGADDQPPRDVNAPMGFFYEVRNALRNGRNNRRARRNDRRARRDGHTAEDWVIYPGRARRDLFSSSTTTLPLPATSPRQQPRDSEAADGDERRLLEDMRSVGLIG